MIRVHARVLLESGRASDITLTLPLNRLLPRHVLVAEVEERIYRKMVTFPFVVTGVEVTAIDGPQDEFVDIGAISILPVLVEF